MPLFGAIWDVGLLYYFNRVFISESYSMTTIKHEIYINCKDMYAVVAVLSAPISFAHYCIFQKTNEVTGLV